MQGVAFKGQAIGRTILGEIDTVKAFKRDSLLAFLGQHYLAQNIVISAVGNLQHDELVSMVSEKFAALKSGSRGAPEKAHFVGGKHLENRPLEQLHVTFGWPGVSYHDDRYYAHQLYSTILGGGMSSRLFQEVRESRGLAYSIYSFSSSHAETGLFGIYAGTSPDMTHDLIGVIRDEMASLAEGPTEQEFKIASAQLKAGLMMALEATTSRMEQLGRQLLVFDRIVPVDEMIGNVDAVTGADIMKVGRSFLEAGEPSVAAVGDCAAL